MKKFTVVGFNDETGGSWMICVEAPSPAKAIYMAASAHPNLTFHSAIAGHLEEGVHYELAGEGVVDGSTVLEQPDVFNADESQLANPTVRVVADHSAYDWRLDGSDEADALPDSMKDEYRVVVERCVDSGKVSFQMYPRSLVDLGDESLYQGLFGVLEIRNGKPAMSFGLTADDIGLHVESDVNNGLYIHADDFDLVETRQFYSHSHGCSFDATYYDFDCSG